MKLLTAISMNSRNTLADAEIVDVHMLTGLANLTNRFTDPVGLELEMPEEKI